MLLVFPGFTGEQFSYFTIYTNLRDIFCLLVLIPIFTIKLKMGECLLMSLGTFLAGIGLFLSGFAVKVWQYYAAMILPILFFPVFSLTRSALTKCIDADEVGKVFSGLAIISALVPFASNPRKMNTKTFVL